jgi:hypothetical protein
LKVIRSTAFASTAGITTQIIATTATRVKNASHLGCECLGLNESATGKPVG